MGRRGQIAQSDHSQNDIINCISNAQVTILQQMIEGKPLYGMAIDPYVAMLASAAPKRQNKDIFFLYTDFLPRHGKRKDSASMYQRELARKSFKLCEQQ